MKVEELLKRPLFVERPVANADDLRRWAMEAGLGEIDEDLHVTVCYSKAPVQWRDFKPDVSTLVNYDVSTKSPESGSDVGHRYICRLGDEGEALVLRIESAVLRRRWQQFIDGGCSWDYESYKPHVTLLKSAPTGVENDIEPYSGPIAFGPEGFRLAKL